MWSKSQKKYVVVLFVLLAFLITTMITSRQSIRNRSSAQEENSNLIAPNQSAKKNASLFPDGFVPGEYIIKLNPTASLNMDRIEKEKGQIIDLTADNFNIASSNEIAPLFETLNQLGTLSLQKLPFTIENRAYIKIRLNKDSKTTQTDVLNRIKNIEGVEYIEPNYVYHTSAITDPYYLDRNPPAWEERNSKKEEGGWNPNFDFQYGLKITHFDENLISTIKNEIVVAVIDTGVDYTHDELKNRIWVNTREMNQRPNFDDDGNGYRDDTIGWNGVHITDYNRKTQEITISSNPIPFDKGTEVFFDDLGIRVSGGHGTHVSGIIASEINGNGGVGVNPKAVIMPLRACLADGSCIGDRIAEMIKYAANNGAMVINLSLGSTSKSQFIEDTIKDTFENNQNIVIVAAAGNEGNDDVFYPAGFEGVIAVSAVDEKDTVTDWSNYGDYIHVAAPGNRILSLRGSETDAYCADEETCNSMPRDSKIYSSHVRGKKLDHLIASGTSMSAPYVSGLASLVIAKNPTLTRAQVTNIIANGADDLGDPYIDKKYGYGRINIQKTLTQMNDKKPTQTQPVVWEINTKLVCENGNQPWTPLPVNAQIHYSVQNTIGTDINNSKTIKSGQTDLSSEIQHRFFINAEIADGHVSMISHIAPTHPQALIMTPMNPLPHPAMHYISNSAFPYYTLSWNNDELPAGQYTIPFIPPAVSGWCADQTWNVETKIVCENGNIPDARNSQILYTIWPNLPSRKYLWQYGADDTSLNKTVAIKTSSGLKNIYVGMWDEHGNMLPLSGKPPTDAVVYGNILGDSKKPIAYWAGSALLNYPQPVALTFKAPESWCDNDLSTPFNSHTTPVDTIDKIHLLPQQIDIETIPVNNTSSNDKKNSDISTDLNNDGVTNSIDILIVIENYSGISFSDESSTTDVRPIIGDVTGDGQVNALDLSKVINVFGE